MCADEVPDDRVLVVRTKGSTAVWCGVLLAAAALDVAISAAIVVLAVPLGFPPLGVLAILVPFAVQALRTGLVVDGRRSAEPPDHIADRLRQVAAWAGR